VNSNLSNVLAQTLSSNRENLMRYSVLLDLCPLPSFFLDHDHKTPVYINPAFCELTGRTLDELQIPDWIKLVIHPEDIPKIIDSWNSFTEEGILFVPWHRYVSKNNFITRATAVLRRLPPNTLVGFILPKCDSNMECPIAKMSKLSPGIPHS
jgi:PAS domain-containing protein